MIRVYGASDDLIEVEGDISEEFPYRGDGESPDYLGFSDGTLLSVQYDENGLWRINRVLSGDALYNKSEATADEKGGGAHRSKTSLRTPTS